MHDFTQLSSDHTEISYHKKSENSSFDEYMFGYALRSAVGKDGYCPLQRIHLF